MIRQVRLSNGAKEQLIRLKTRTGIGQWNVLCRWAFCTSLAEPTPPTPIDIATDSNVEMTWEVFAGPWGELYEALLVDRVRRDHGGSDVAVDEETFRRQFTLHLHRGIGYLATPGRVTRVEDLWAG